MQISSILVIKTTERKAVMWLEFVKILIFITVDIVKHTAKKIRKLNEQIKFYLKCMVPPEDIHGVILKLHITVSVM